MENHNNIMLMTDSYKSTHYNFYPKNTTKIYSYLEARGGDLPEAVFFGLQYYLKKYLSGVQVTPEKIDEAEKFWNSHFGFNRFNREGWEHILKQHNGVLPLRIKAVPEGTVVPIKNVMMTIENTDPKCFWLTNYIETLLMKLWGPITIASNSRRLKKLISKYYDKTTDLPEDVKAIASSYSMHDFGYRGVSSEESARILGAAHLINFRGTDTAGAIQLLQDYYEGGEAGAIGNSVDATEHSVMCSFGKDDELGAIRNAIDAACEPDGTPVAIASIVSDTYDIYQACDKYYGQELRELILSRQTKNGDPAKIVVRPDSGDPIDVLLGDETSTDPLVREGVLSILYRHFPGGVNEKGYKVLDPHIGVLQGDGIDYEMTRRILKAMEINGFAASNMVFGSGGGLLQKFNRDSMKFAIKASYAEVDGEHRDLIKTPVTSPGKKSKSGRLKLINYSESVMTVQNSDTEHGDIMQEVFVDGKIIKEYSLQEIRDRVDSYNNRFDTRFEG